MRLGKHRKLLLVAVLIVVMIVVGVFAYYQIQQIELVSFLTQYGAYKPNVKYTALSVLDVDTLPKPSGNLTFGTLLITYAFHQPDNIDNVPYFWLTYVSGGTCTSTGSTSSSDCHEMLLIIPDNNVTTSTRQPPLYANPLNSYGFELSKVNGEHIEWHLYLFLATFTGNSETTLLVEPLDEFVCAPFGMRT